VKILVFFIFGIQFPVFCQMLDNSKGEAFGDLPFFNQDFIRRNKIKQITGAHSAKRQGELINDTDLKSVYEFDSLGRLIHHYETVFDKKEFDTLLTAYIYDASGAITSIRTVGNGGTSSLRYVRDSLHRVSEKSFVKEIDTSGSILDNEPELITIINSEFMKYDSVPLELRCKYSNSYGFSYMDKSWYYHPEGYLLREEERLRMTNGLTILSYAYNERGYISSISTDLNADGAPEKQLAFTYDEMGNLLEKKVYKNNDFLYEVQIIYNSKTGLMSSIFTRDIKTGFISIYRFNKYAYW
jgi:hypothetical protein